MASNYWMKLWIEVIDDPKMGRLSDNLWRRFFECCLIAKELNQGGRLPTVPDVAWRLRVDQETLELEFDQMARVGLLEYIADQVLDGHWLITNFVRRQSKMNPSERMRRKREQDRKRDSYGTCYEPVTVRNTETETETETETDNIYLDALEIWGLHFPEKTQPRKNNQKLKKKAITRKKNNCRISEAIKHASKNDHLVNSGWFQLEYILRNDETSEKVLNGAFDGFMKSGNQRGKNIDPLAGINAAMEKLNG